MIGRHGVSDEGSHGEGAHLLRAGRLRCGEGALPACNAGPSYSGGDNGCMFRASFALSTLSHSRARGALGALLLRVGDGLRRSTLGDRRGLFCATSSTSCTHARSTQGVRLAGRASDAHLSKLLVVPMRRC